MPTDFSKKDIRALERKLKVSKLTYNDIADEFDISYNDARGMVAQLDNRHLQEERYERKKQFWIQEDRPKEVGFAQYEVPTDEYGGFKIAAISCTHLGSIYEEKEALQSFYDRLEDEGVGLVIHAGDVFEGIKGAKRKRQLNELKFYGYNRMLDYAESEYPERENTVTAAISGNHDGWMWDEVGADPVEELGRRRDDIDYVGFELADIEVNGVHVKVQHPMGGMSYARSYKIQRYLNEMEHKPDIYLVGHYHVNTYMRYGGVDAFLLGCFKGQDPFTSAIGKYPDIGGWIIYIRPDDKGGIEEISPTWVSYEVTRGGRDGQHINRVIGE